MAFRQEKRGRLEWQNWLQSHRDLLVECGLPAEVYESGRSWDYFLWEGATRANWHFLESLDPAQTVRLYHFLNAEYGGGRCEPSILPWLRTRLGLPQRLGPPGKD